jgi:four helix bundle protein
VGKVLKDKRQVDSWKDLEVWRVSHSLVVKVYEMIKGLPKDEPFRLTDQICRAATSVPTNLAEGKGRNSLREYLQFLSIPRGSVEEVKYLLLLCKDLSYIPENTYAEMIEEYDQVGRMLNGLMKSLRLHVKSSIT